MNHRGNITCISLLSGHFTRVGVALQNREIPDVNRSKIVVNKHIPTSISRQFYLRTHLAVGATNVEVLMANCESSSVVIVTVNSCNVMFNFTAIVHLFVDKLNRHNLIM